MNIKKKILSASLLTTLLLAQANTASLAIIAQEQNQELESYATTGYKDVSPADGTKINKAPILSVTPTGGTGEMTVTFKKGDKYDLSNQDVFTRTKGVSNTDGQFTNDFVQSSGNGFPYELFEIKINNKVTDNTTVTAQWSGKANNSKTFMYAYNTARKQWDKLDAQQTVKGESMTLSVDILVKNYIVDGKVKVVVQNGEGYTPPQYTNQSPNTSLAMNKPSDSVETKNENDTPRQNYDFTFVVQSDTQYYNEGAANSKAQGKYQHQLNMNNWIVANRQRMNMQYLFHDGDIIDNYKNTKEWKAASAAYQKFDDTNLPYGVLAGNHDVSKDGTDYSWYSTYFGSSRFASNPWYRGNYKDNRGHYDLITVNGIDFIMVYMGWKVGDEEIAWLNGVLAQYPERTAILNFHGYLNDKGTYGTEQKKIKSQVVAKNKNVRMVLSGHYDNTLTDIETFTDADGSKRTVYNLLFNYQYLKEGGAGYFRLMHFDIKNKKIIFRTFTPSYGGTQPDNYGDYNSKALSSPNVGNEFTATREITSSSYKGQDIDGDEDFTINFSELGIVPKVKTLETTSFNINVYQDTTIASTSVKSGSPAQYEWKNAPDGRNGWYAEIRGQDGAITRTDVQYFSLKSPKKITFDTQGGTSIQDIEAYENSEVDLSKYTPSRAGYTFAGWFDAKGTEYKGKIKMPAGGLNLIAKWTAKSYKVTYKTNGGSSVKGTTAKTGSKLTAPASPTRKGYTFAGWYKDKKLKQAWDFKKDTMPSTKLTLYAKWTVNNSYKVTFNSNGGSAVEAITVKAGLKLKAPKAPTRKGYTFVGWYKDKKLKQAWNFKKDTMPSTKLTLYAKWTANSYKVSYKTSGGSSVKGITAKTGTKLTVPTAPTRKGYTFVGWYKDWLYLKEAWDFDKDTMPSHDLTLYAKWTANSYKVSYDTNGGSSVEGTTAKTGAKLTAPASPTRKGYTFAGWYKDKKLKQAWDFKKDTMPGTKLTLYAKWTANSYKVSYDTNGGSSVKGTTAKTGAKLKTPKTPKREGYTFAGWYKDKKLKQAWDFKKDTMPGTKLTLYAKWTASSYKVSYDTNGGSSVKGTTAKTGTKLIVPASPTRKGYTFAGWYTNWLYLGEAWDFDKHTMPGHDLTLYAKWTAKSYKVSYKTNGGSSVKSTKAKTGAKLKTPKTPTRKGYTFAGWYKDKKLKQAWNFKKDTMPSTKLTLYAKWTAKS